jgi:hypothetical protein
MLNNVPVLDSLASDGSPCTSVSALVENCLDKFDTAEAEAGLRNLLRAVRIFDVSNADCSARVGEWSGEQSRDSEAPV